jgi:hypothetical protein
MSDKALLTVCITVGIMFFFASFYIPELVQQWRKARADAANAALKQQMIERGFTADEIAKVIAAGSVAPGAVEKQAEVEAES